VVWMSKIIMKKETAYGGTLIVEEMNGSYDVSFSHHDKANTLCTMATEAEATKLVKLITGEKVNPPATTEEIERARDMYTDSEDNLEIDDDAISSRTDNGVWISSWVWLSKGEE